MGWACSAYGEEERRGFDGATLEEKDHLKNPSVDRRIILGCVFRQWDVGIWTGSSWLRIGTVGRHL